MLDTLNVFLDNFNLKKKREIFCLLAQLMYLNLYSIITPFDAFKISYI